MLSYGYLVAFNHNQAEASDDLQQLMISKDFPMLDSLSNPPERTTVGGKDEAPR